MARSRGTEINEPAIGAHVSGGLKGAVPKALDIGAQVLQIFIGSPQSWKSPNPGLAELDSFVQGIEKHALGPIFVHGNYLVNLASASPYNLHNSVENLRLALRLADRVRAEGVIFHPGSAGKTEYQAALRQVVGSVERVLDGYEGHCRLLLEVCAGQGQTIGDRFSQFRDILSSLGFDKRLGVCWDTCHLFNAGYDVSTKDGLERTIEEFESEVGFPWLKAIHANDSKTPLGRRRDRHENIGQGFIGEEGFRRLLHHPQLRLLPWILEVPGFEQKGPDRKNIQILHRLAGSRNRRLCP